jgi:hypothetical protein
MHYIFTAREMIQMTLLKEGGYGGTTVPQINISQ